MEAPRHRLSRLRKLAWACALLVLAITSLSAFIRLSRAGIGCAPWPQCYAQRAGLAPEMLEKLDPPAVTAARVVHRVAASAALLLMILMLMATLARQPVLWPQGRIVLAMMALALFLAVLGRMGGASRSPAVGLGNLLGGFALFALNVRLLRAGDARGPGAPSLRGWALAALALVLLQVALGALVGVGQLADRCGEAGLCQAHRVTGLAVAALLLPLGLQAWRCGERALGAALAALGLVQATLGVLQLASGLPLALALAHNVSGALLLAVLLALLPGRPARS